MIPVLIILAGIYLLLIGGLTAFATLNLITHRAEEPQTGMMLLGVGFYALLSLWVLITAVGVFCRQNWARISIFVMSGFALFSGGAALLGMIFFPSPGKNIPPSSLWFFGGLMMIFSVLIPLVFIMLFKSKKGREWFLIPEGSSSAVSPGSRPVIVTVLSVYYGLSIFTLFFMFSKPFRGTMEVYPLGNMILPPVVGYAFMLGATIISVVLAYGLFKMKRWAWPLMVGLSAFYCLQMTLTFFMMSPETAQKVLTASQQYLPPEAQSTMSPNDLKRGYIMGLILPAITMVYALLNKKMFYRSVDQPS